MKHKVQFRQPAKFYKDKKGKRIPRREWIRRQNISRALKRRYAGPAIYVTILTAETNLKKKLWRYLVRDIDIKPGKDVEREMFIAGRMEKFMFPTNKFLYTFKVCFTGEAKFGKYHRYEKIKPVEYKNMGLGGSNKYEWLNIIHAAYLVLIGREIFHDERIAGGSGKSQTNFREATKYQKWRGKVHFEIKER